MSTIKDIIVKIFLTLKDDQELLNLLEVPSTNMSDIRKQILEDVFPSDLIEANKPRVTIIERPSYVNELILENGYIEIDIFVPKEINKKDRRVLLIAQRIKDILDKAKVGLGMTYMGRVPNLPIDHPDWVRYAVLFKYDKINL